MNLICKIFNALEKKFKAIPCPIEITENGKFLIFRGSRFEARKEVQSYSLIYNFHSLEVKEGLTGVEELKKQIRGSATLEEVQASNKLILEEIRGSDSGTL